VRLEHVETIADGLRASIGERNWALISRHVDEVCGSKSEIVAAMRLAWERLKIVIEPSAAVAARGNFLRHGCRWQAAASG
jgi:threonine dehydratase